MEYRRVGFFGMCVCFGGEEWGWAWMKMKTVTPLSLRLPPSPSPSFPGGLYGWKWGVLSATSLAQTVPSALSEDQPERGETDYHRYRGSVPHRKAAHSPGIPHGELQPALQCGVFTLAAVDRCESWGDSVLLCLCVVLLLLQAENVCSLFNQLCVG